MVYLKKITYLKQLNKVKNLKASIFVTNYNNAKFITKCLNSVINQDYKNIEILFIDDLSLDNSLEIVKKFKNKIKIIKKKTKKTGIGSFDQMQSLFECYKKSRGDIIFFLDSDDYFKKKKVSKFMNLFSQKKNLKALYDLPILKSKKSEIKMNLKYNLFKNLWSDLVPTSCIAMRRNSFKELYRLTNFKKFKDIWFDFRILIALKANSEVFQYLNDHLTFYRQLETSASSNFKYLSKNWWKRRSQAHQYVKFFLKKNNIFYKKNFDYFLTKSINKFL